MSPQRTNLILTTNIPNIELCVLVCNSLDVEANGRDGGNVLLEFEVVEDSCCNSTDRLAHGQAGATVMSHCR